MKFSGYTKGRFGTLALRAVQVAELSLGSMLALCIFERIAEGDLGGITPVTKVIPPESLKDSNTARISLAKFTAADGNQSYI